jgi:hypothetical protein
MPSVDRAAGRTVHLFDAQAPDAVLGGLRNTDAITNANFYAMVDIVLSFDAPYVLRDQGGQTLVRDNNQLQAGNYYTVTEGEFLTALRSYSATKSWPQGSVTITNETPLLRAFSRSSTGTRVRGFVDAVRTRDRRCVVTKKAAENQRGEWTGFEAAHIFPLAHEEYWNQQGFSRWITMVPSTGGSINSVQNGLLLRADVQQLFDAYYLSINPDVSTIACLEY